MGDLKLEYNYHWPKDIVESNRTNIVQRTKPTRTWWNQFSPILLSVRSPLFIYLLVLQWTVVVCIFLAHQPVGAHLHYYCITNVGGFIAAYTSWFSLQFFLFFFLFYFSFLFSLLLAFFVFFPCFDLASFVFFLPILLFHFQLLLW